MGRLESFFLAAKLVPKPLEPALVNHVEEFLAVGPEFQASFADLAFLDFDVGGREIAAQNQHADTIRHSLNFPHCLSGSRNSGRPELGAVDAAPAEATKDRQVMGHILGLRNVQGLPLDGVYVLARQQRTNSPRP